MMKSSKTGFLKARGRRRRAAAIVEFAVVMPVLLLILFGIIEFGQLFRIRQTCLHAAREGARLAVLQSTAKPYTSGPVATRVEQIMRAGGVNYSPSMLSVTAETAGDPMVKVTLTVPYDEVKLTGFLGPITDSVSGTCAMRKEGV